jgi:hypothetical protein
MDREQPRLPDCGQLDAAIEERHNAALANDGSQGRIDFPPQDDDNSSNVGRICAILDPIGQGGRLSRRRVISHGSGPVWRWHVVLLAARTTRQSVTTGMGL